jgi:hypothetical protein
MRAFIAYEFDSFQEYEEWFNKYGGTYIVFTQDNGKVIIVDAGTYS